MTTQSVSTLSPATSPRTSLTCLSPIPKSASHLNSHILFHLFAQFPSILSKSDLLNAALVCRDWADVAISEIWRNLDLNVGAEGFGQMRRLDKVLMDPGRVHMGLLIRKMDVSVVHEGPGWGELVGDDGKFERVVDGLDVLRGLIWRVKRLDVITLNFKVKTGRLNEDQHFALFDRLHLLIAILASRPELRINIAYNMPVALLMMDGIVLLENRLQNVMINGGWSEEEELVEVLRTLPKVTGLRLRRCPIGLETFEVLKAKHSAALRRFEVEGAANLGKMLGEIVAQCERLTHFEWKVSPKPAYGSVLGVELKMLPHSLTHLSLDGVIVSAEFSAGLRHQCPELKHVSVTKMRTDTIVGANLEDYVFDGGDNDGIVRVV